MNGGDEILRMARAARLAARAVARMAPGGRDAVLEAMAAGIDAARAPILEANRADTEAAKARGMSAAFLDRLALDVRRIDETIRGIIAVSRLTEPLGERLSAVRRPNGLLIEKVRVPLGVIAVIYESRPSVTADAAALCLKAGSAVILRGGSEALRSNTAIWEAMAGAGEAAGMPRDAVQLVRRTDREAVAQLLSMDRFVDLVIPRGGESLIRAVGESSRVPVLKHFKGVCHVYVDRAADLDMALRIAVNAKCQRPGVCNAMETLLVHEAVAAGFLPAAATELRARGVEIRGDEATRQLVPAALPATEEDWSTEYLDLILSVRVVENLEAAIEHIERYGTRHSDVIVTNDPAAAERFLGEVDSAAVYVNASSRFTDGAEFGMGAEIGISTDKLHARGPCGPAELTTYKYLIRGTGQVRE
jgi:glutamate-5-semialdehyde dehydrogenase